VLASSREKADTVLESPRSRVAAIFIVCVWLACTAVFAYWLLRK
jgi:hypothetical protein